MAEIDNRILIGVLGLLAGVYGWIIKHLWKHPAGDAVVYKDVFNSELKRIEDCWESELKGLRKEIQLRFDRLEELINGRK